MRVRGPAEGEYSHCCCNVKHAGDKPYHSYFTYRCVSSCPDEEQCVRPPSSEPETPLFNVPTCVDASQYANCTLFPDGFTLDVTSGTCLTLETTPDATLEEVAVATSAGANMGVTPSADANMEGTPSADANMEGTPAADANTKISVVAFAIAVWLGVFSLVEWYLCAWLVLLVVHCEAFSVLKL